ncbi:vWA domain-containing protein [Legionella israelensis]|uniref:VWFA domain-containing protein n=1 Tax=Legionella israelensis TaxID=454 RepID=A0A0W0WQG7_9GAMM|nr:VWA domain-containing protein [Legionella israelensis]KTD34577.1 hypothetical protein Lisr_0121 [Legionella israelensis]QBS11091.1 VWA domain-containing protein [Legionella israelensis]SCX99819.1 Ca-activated chloride channel family protein [Legionella israelensis DSM 19235]STX60411.1 BatA [Legionella israelensis]
MFELAMPWALLLLLLPPCIWYLLPRAKPPLPTALRVPFFHAISSIVDKDKRVLTQQSSLMLPFLIWLFAVIALSGPRWVGQPQPVSREGYNIIMALDLSGSMEIPDMLFHGRPVNRLDVVKHAAEQFVKERTGDKIGLILFGSRAYLQSPLTYDRHSVLLRIQDATVGLAGKTTSIGDALGLAIKHLQKMPRKGRVIILLTDGANNSGILQPVKAAELAKTESIKIYTIGLGSSSDSRALSGVLLMPGASADLDEKTLKKIANVTGGRYFRATDSQSLQTIYQTINQLEAISQEHTTIQPQKDYYPWPLALALILFFVWLLERTDLRQHIKSVLQRNRGHLKYDN